MEIESEFKSIIDSTHANFFYIACSGGVDSMVLLHLARRFDLAIHVLHVNYNLRGNDSLYDADFLKRYCIQNNIPISIHDVNLKEQLKELGGNLQNEARKIRYDFFQKKLNEVENSKLLVAHNQDDQIETFWLQLYRGSGLKGMAGMQQISGDLVRPLLNISKKDIISFAKTNQIEWREDKSNSKSDYQRNLFRNKYLPFLRSEISSMNDSVLFIQQIFRENLNQISAKLNEVLHEINNNNYIEINKIFCLKITEIIELFRSLAIPIHQVKSFLKLFNSQKGSKLFWENPTGDFCEIIRERNGFSFTRINQRFKIPELNIETVDRLPDKFDKTTLYFDLTKIKGEIKIRFWQKGDRICPIGMKGSKLISDVISDAKIPHAQRYNQLVIFDEEKILAALGLCVDRRAFAYQTTSIVRVSLQNEV